MNQKYLPLVALLVMAGLPTKASAQQDCAPNLSEQMETAVDELDYADCSDEQPMEKDTSDRRGSGGIDRDVLEKLTDGKGLSVTPHLDLTPVRAEAADEAKSVAAETARRKEARAARPQDFGFAALLGLLFLVLAFGAYRMQREKHGS